MSRLRIAEGMQVTKRGDENGSESDGGFFFLSFLLLAQFEGLFPFTRANPR